MSTHRADPLLNEAIEALDHYLARAKKAIPKANIDEQRALAWTFLTPTDLSFVVGEITHAATDRVYYLENYHVIQTENGVLTCMAPLYDLQWMIEEALRNRIAQEGRAFLVVLKPRQSGGTEYANGVMCQRTFFLSNAFTMTVAQDPGTSAWVQRKVTIAYDNLPWWMKPERQYHTKGEYMEFGRKDQALRSADPGLGTVLVTTHALREQGVAIGRTIRSLHMTEVSRWPSSDLYSSDIKPTMHAPDTIAIAESTAYGLNNFFHNLWEGATDEEDDDTDWVPVFLPAYRDKKNRRSIPPRRQPLILTDVEQGIADRVLAEEGYSIPPEFWNFRRRGIKDSIKESGYPYGHLECYPVSPREAFQSSGAGAFVRHKLDEQEGNVRKPGWIGEVVFQGRDMVPKILLQPMCDDQGRYLQIPIPKRDYTNRLHLWEYPPDPGASYYLAADAGEGVGQDFSVAEIMRAGKENDPDVQVGEWVGYDPPEAFGRQLYALGFLFNRCEIAVEYNGPGRATADYLMNQLEYPALYVPRHTDRLKGQFAAYRHWQTTSKTKPLLRAKMNETLLENGIVIRSEYVLNELRGCEAFGESFGAVEGHDDAAISLTIALYCLRQTLPELRQTVIDAADSAARANSSAALARSLHPPIGAIIYGVYDEFARCRVMPRTIADAEAIIHGDAQRNIAPHSTWSIRPIRVSKANTAFSSIHHGTGLENELYRAGMMDRDVTPDLTTAYAASTDRLTQHGQLAQRMDGAASPSAGGGADSGSWWDSAAGELGGGDMSDWGEMV